MSGLSIGAWMCAAALAAVLVLLTGSAIAHRRANTQHCFHRHWSVELAWALAPQLIIVLFALPAFANLLLTR